MSRTLSDNPNIYKTGGNEKCIPSHYKGALVVAQIVIIIIIEKMTMDSGVTNQDTNPPPTMILKITDS